MKLIHFNNCSPKVEMLYRLHKDWYISIVYFFEGIQGFLKKYSTLELY